MFKKVLIIGLGLIGGSLALSLRKAKITNQIFAFNRDQKSLEFAINNKIIDGIISLKDDDLTSFDLIVIATPLKAYKDIALLIEGRIHKDVILTDLGSLKNFTFVIFSSKNFVATHPIAGLEKIGVQHAVENLFIDKNLIICQSANTSNAALKKIEILWQKIGSKVQYLDAKKHDEIYSLVSHLPQFLAFIFKKIIPYQAANISLIKASRLDNSNIEMWKDIFDLNKSNIKFFLEEFLEFMQDFQVAIQVDDSAILQLLTKLPNQSLENSEVQKLEFLEIESIFVEFVTRAIVALTFLKIKKITEYQLFGGSGFYDFILPAKILQELHQSKEIFLVKYKQNKVAILQNLRKIEIEIKNSL